MGCPRILQARKEEDVRNLLACRERHHPGFSGWTEKWIFVSFLKKRAQKIRAGPRRRNWNRPDFRAGRAVGVSMDGGEIPRGNTYEKTHSFPAIVHRDRLTGRIRGTGERRTRDSPRVLPGCCVWVFIARMTRLSWPALPHNIGISPGFPRDYSEFSRYMGNKSPEVLLEISDLCTMGYKTPELRLLLTLCRQPLLYGNLDPRASPQENPSIFLIFG